MPTQDEINAEKERLYESSPLRDDLNDDEATVLLNWGQTQIDRLALAYPEEFEQKARFLRQLLKNINRFVGQREFNDQTGQAKYMKKVSMYLPPLGWPELTMSELFEILPQDAADMAANLDAILTLLTSISEKSDPTMQDDPPPDDPVVTDFHSSFKAAMIKRHHNDQLSDDTHRKSVNQSGDDNWMGENADYGEQQ